MIDHARTHAQARTFALSLSSSLTFISVANFAFCCEILIIESHVLSAEERCMTSQTPPTVRDILSTFTNLYKLVHTIITVLSLS